MSRVARAVRVLALLALASGLAIAGPAAVACGGGQATGDDQTPGGGQGAPGSPPPCSRTDAAAPPHRYRPGACYCLITSGPPQHESDSAHAQAPSSLSEHEWITWISRLQFSQT